MLITILIASGAALVYTWFGYPSVLALAARFSNIRIEKSAISPATTVIVAARNEEANIAARIENLLNLHYPSEKLEIIIASDGSTDRTVELASSFADLRVRVLDFPESRGRAAVHNDAVAHARGEILVFTDAATRCDQDFLARAVANFADPGVGCVSARITFENRHGSTVARQRGIYWRYEFWLRKLESQCGIMACASGPCMAVRRELFRPITHSSYDVDFMTPLDVIETGSLVIQDEGAMASDEMFSAPRQEFRAQARMVSRNLRGYCDRRWLVFANARLRVTCGLLSHKLLRWMTPFFLLLFFAANSALLVRGQMVALWFAQLAFYAAALAGWWFVRSSKPASVFSAPFSFCLANLGFLMGVWKCLRDERIAIY